MGYTTDFNGSFDLDKPLTTEHREYLEAFSRTRRMKRDAEKASKLPDPIREAAGLPIGETGAYFVGADGFAGQDQDASVVNYNGVPNGQPGLWCQWTPGEDGETIEWDGGEKFYEYEEWLVYIIEHFLKPWGYTLNGDVTWEGEDSEDKGMLRVQDNEVSTLYGRVIYE